MERRQFTLIELLTVITIIAILVGILFPALNAARQKGKEAKAQTEINQLKTAVTEYESTYGVLPAVSDVGSSDQEVGGDYTDFIKLLQNEGGGNPREIRFLDVKTQPGEYQDPWQQDYGIALDYDYNGKIDLSSVTSDMGDTVYADVAAWSVGDDGNADTEDDITTWSD